MRDIKHMFAALQLTLHWTKIKSSYKYVTRNLNLCFGSVSIWKGKAHTKARGRNSANPFVRTK